MDKNTLIGFLLIGVVLFAFSWFNQPTPEQIEAQRRYMDSIAKIEQAQKLELSSGSDEADDKLLLSKELKKNPEPNGSGFFWLFCRSGTQIFLQAQAGVRHIHGDLLAHIAEMPGLVGDAGDIALFGGIAQDKTIFPAVL